MMKTLWKNAALGALALVGLGASGCTITDLADYEPCSFDSDCDSNYCKTITIEYDDAFVTDSFCTVGCSSNSDCFRTSSGLPGTCDNLDGEFVCFETCDGDFDCAAGFACVPFPPVDAYCVPF